MKKDAHMLDAFGKGASEDIRSAKEELYNQVPAAQPDHILVAETSSNSYLDAVGI